MSYAHNQRLLLATTCIGGLACMAQVPEHDWTRHWGGNGDDHNGGLVVDVEGNVYSLSTVFPGCTIDTASHSPWISAHGATDIQLLKYDTLGHVIWGGKAGGSGYDSGSGIAIATDGALYVIGYIKGAADMDLTIQGSWPVEPIAEDDIVLARYSPDGAVQWAFAMGGPDDDWGYGVAATHDGGVLVTGYFQDSMDVDPDTASIVMRYSNGDKDIFIAKYTASGALEWANVVGGPEGDVAYAIDADDAGNAYITGYFRQLVDFDPGPAEHLLQYSCSRAYLASYTSTGAYRWAFAFGASCQSSGNCVRTTPSGDVYATGRFGYTSDFDPGPELHQLNATENGAAYLAKYDSAGQYLWAVNYGTKSSTGYALDIDASGTVYTAGTFFGPMDAAPGPDSCILVGTPGNADLFASKFSAEGVWQWSGAVTGEGHNRAPRIRQHGGNVYLSGDYSVNADFDLGPSEVLTDPVDKHGIFLARYTPASESMVAIPQTASIPSVGIHPNPASSFARLSGLDGLSDARLTLCDALGRVIHREAISTGHTLLDVRYLPKGAYLVRIEGSSFLRTGKLLVE